MTPGKNFEGHNLIIEYGTHPTLHDMTNGLTAPSMGENPEYLCIFISILFRRLLQFSVRFFITESSFRVLKSLRIYGLSFG